jgi:hypothetical protein
MCFVVVGQGSKSRVKKRKQGLVPNRDVLTLRSRDGLEETVSWLQADKLRRVLDPNWFIRQIGVRE